jgi:4-amino-4-deoxy-L-arabinose transferase-like glycosyltransferase
VTQLPVASCQLPVGDARHLPAGNWQLTTGNCIFIALCGFLFFYHLGVRDLWSSHEARAAQDARSMVQDGYWGVPRLFDQQLDLQKPPLYYWLVALTAWVRGGVVDAWAVRLPAALAALATVLTLLGFAANHGRYTTGLIAGLVLATAVHFTWLARIGRIDMPLTLTVSVALIAFHRALNDECRSWSWYLLGYSALAAAVLLKGPVGLVLVGAVLTVHVLVEGRLNGWSPLRRGLSSLLWGIPLLLVLVFPWFVWASAQTGGRLTECFLWHHNIERALGSGSLRAHPWWFYAPRLCFDLLPWSVLLPLALGDLRGGRWRADPLARFGLIWFAVMVLVLSGARFKRADYLLPAYPGAALLVGCMLTRRLVGHVSNAPLDQIGTLDTCPTKRPLVVMIGTVAVAAVVGWWYYLDRALPCSEPARECRSFAATIRAAAPAPQLVIFFRAEAHALALHVGRPINTVLEWENIAIWVERPGEHYFVMPPECVRQWTQHIGAATLEVLASNAPADGSEHERPLVLARSVPTR